MRSIYLFILLYILSNSLVLASDIEREKRITAQMVDAIFDGEPVYLTDSLKHTFLGIFMPSDSSNIKGGAIIMHGRGTHPNWKDVTQPLRTSLPSYNWSTLSIQMPVLEKTAKYNDYVQIFSEAGPRIESAIRFMKSKGINRIVLIAHSCSVHMSMHWLRNNNSENIIAYIGIGMGATDYQQPMKKPFPLSKLNFPILDVYGSNDHKAVRTLATERLKTIKQAGHEKSKQIMITDSDHDHKDNNSKLIETVTQWLNRLND